MARAAGGRFLLRIEDIDATRCRPEFEAAIYEDLAWLGIAWEEPVRRQSEHFEDYRDGAAALEARAADSIRASRAARRLRASSADRESHGALAARSGRRAALSGHGAGDGGGRAAGADRARRALRDPPRHDCGDGSGRAAAWIETGAGPPARPARSSPIPQAWGDVILGRKETPTSYHLSVVIDDALQGVTHVVRGQDLFWSTSVHRLLQALLALPAPAYHHHRLMLDADGRKLSKSTQCHRPARTARAGRDARRYPQAGRACRVAANPASWHGDAGRRARGPVPKRQKRRKLRRRAGPRRPSRRARASARKPCARRVELALAGLAHDIRTPLTGMLALSRSLARLRSARARAQLGRSDQGRGRASGAAHHARGRRRARPEHRNLSCSAEPFALRDLSTPAAHRSRRAPRPSR